MVGDEGLTPGDSTQGENAIAVVARRMANCIERLPDDVVASFASVDTAERVSRLKRIANEISLGMAPVVNWSERRRAADTAALLKERLYYALEEAITCSSCDIPEYSGGAICKTDDRTSDGARRTATLLVVAKLLANSLREWAGDIEFEDTQRSATSTAKAERLLDGTTKPSGSKKKSGKRSTEKGEARTKIVAGLMQHHGYDNGSCQNYEPIGVNDLASSINVSQGSVSAFFKKEFRNHLGYRAACLNSTNLAVSLKLLNGEYSPHFLFERVAPGEGIDGDDED